MSDTDPLLRQRFQVSDPPEESEVRTDEAAAGDGDGKTPDDIDDNLRAQDGTDSEWEEKCVEEKVVENVSKNVPKGTDLEPKYLDYVLDKLPPKWKNYMVRFLFTWFMLGGFGLLIALGPLALMFATLIVQVKCFAEIINIGYSVYRIHGLPWFRSLSWYFLLTSNYFFYGESLVDYFGVLINKTDVLRAVVMYHRFISFSLYIFGFVWFVLSLVKKYYLRQFSLFAWTHVALLICVTQSYLIIQNSFEGLIWFIIPVSMIICNDIMAYMFGFFFGKTPLIQLSPKKTWEGFVGGGISTVIFGAIAAHFMSRYQYFVCPIQYSEEASAMVLECEPPPVFTLTKYQLFGHGPGFWTYPFVWHSIALSLFASIIGPFGGFFASGFKRAFKIKDFGDVIPGHGGILDRFDCQYLMATFVNVYLSSFIRTPSPQKLMQQVMNLGIDQQVAFFHALGALLRQRGHLPEIDGLPQPNL
ncbi:unnamed protein product [Notodromas monacha]|uniref:Phosphatidate cytidylyltransferase n=1 Tax=Notodromas monacha TaxID=399045 RepID=A0A7R9BMT8_9CRUS|nr:unnamed protein product [Notodromas monacha]CAG0917039.1 unnamed protein product [Notodromas monacha]